MELMAPTTVRDRVREAVSISKLSMKALSEKAGLAANHVEQITSGRVKRPSADTLAAIADAAGVSVEWLVNGRGDPSGTKPARGALTVVREPTEDESAGDLPRGLARALHGAMDLSKYDPADFDAARRALAESFRSTPDGADVDVVARRALEGARAARLAGGPVTTEAILRRIAWGRT